MPPPTVAAPATNVASTTYPSQPTLSSTSSPYSPTAVASSVTTTAPTSHPTPPSTCEHYGCLGSVDNFKDFSKDFSSHDMNMEKCTSECKAAGFIFAGLYSTYVSSILTYIAFLLTRILGIATAHPQSTQHPATIMATATSPALATNTKLAEATMNITKVPAAQRWTSC